MAFSPSRSLTRPEKARIFRETKLNGEIKMRADILSVTTNLRGKEVMMRQVTKRMVKEFVRKRLGEEKQAIRALLKIYSYQTADEQATDTTRVRNHIGFTGYDAELLSKFAKQYIERKAAGLPEHRWLSKRQKEIIVEIMPKYWKQIVESCNKEKLDSQVLAAQPAQQLELAV